MIKKTVLLAFVCAFTTLAFSQKPANTNSQKPANANPPTAEQRAARITAKMKKDLSLNATQEAQVNQINIDAAKRTDAIMKQVKDQKTATKDQKASSKDQITASEKQRDTELQKVLTSEQYTKYLQLKEEKKQEAMQKRAEKKDAQNKDAQNTSKPAPKK